MIIDSRLTFSDRQAATAGAASTNTIDLTDDRNIGPGRTMWIVVQADATVAADTTVSLETSATEAGSYEAIASAVIPAGTTLGTRFVIGMPYKNQRFLRLSYDAVGTFSAFLTDQEPASWQAYPGVN